MLKITHTTDSVGSETVAKSDKSAIRTLDEKATAMIARGADIYVQRWQQYAKGLKRIG